MSKSHKSIAELYQRFDSLMDSVFSNNSDKILIARENYPEYLEGDIQRAVYFKRQGDYLTSIEIYLSIFEENKIIYPAIMYFMYKSVLLSGDLVFAYEVIVYAELFVIKALGKYARTPFGDYTLWTQTIARKELEEIIIQFKPTHFIMKGSEVEVEEKAKSNFIHNCEVIRYKLKPLVEKYSGGAIFDEAAMSMVDDSIDNVLYKYQLFRNQGYFD